MAIAIERTDADIKCWKVPSDLQAMDKLMTPQHDCLFNKAEGAMPQPNTLVYISGPVSAGGAAGLNEMAENLAVFTRAERLLLSLGCHVFNPAHIQGPIDPLQGEALWQYCMHFCVRALPECDSVFFLPDWQNSKGARWEHKIAEVLGLSRLYAPVHDPAESHPVESTDEAERGTPPAALPDHE